MADWRHGILTGTLLAAIAACGSAPRARSDTDSPLDSRQARRPRVDPCLPKAGQAEAEPLVRRYDGVARAARCQPEVLTIMADVADALGVGCDYCHDAHDYRVATRRKDVANWMARELVPRLSAKGGGPAVTCADCHQRDGKPSAKILGSPRSESRAIEWMTSELVEKFSRADGKPLRCKSCHGGNLGSAEFRSRLLLTNALSELPRRDGP